MAGFIFRTVLKADNWPRENKAAGRKPVDVVFSYDFYDIKNVPYQGHTCIFERFKIQTVFVKYRAALLIVLLVIIADQASKIYVKTHFYNGEEINVIGHWFRLHFLENPGMAFGMQFSKTEVGKLLLTSFRLIAVIAGFIALKKLVVKGYGRGVIICGALILAGALGNLIDSLFYGLIFTESSFHMAKLVPWGKGYGPLFHGRVVDMLYFPLFRARIGGREFEFFEPVFNIADAAITIGVLTLVIFQKKLLGKHLHGHKVKSTDSAIHDAAADIQRPASTEIEITEEAK